jgi:enediyne biosynthesis protein E4
VKRLLICAVIASTATALPASAAWEGFDQIQPINSGLSAPFQLDASYVTPWHVGGASAGDVDGDGLADVVLLRGGNPPRLFINQGDDTFLDRTTAAGLAGIDGIPNGAVLADVNGDGTLDLLLGGIREGTGPEQETTPMRLFLNNGQGVFTDATTASNLASSMDAHSMALADIDGDGHLDLAVAYWQPGNEVGLAEGHLWRNLGGGQFEDISLQAGVGPFHVDDMFHFTPNFTDLDGDGNPDLLMAADFENSRVFKNNGDGTFSDATDSNVITDENGMGATVGDFDNDGHMDWFVTSIWDEESSDQYGTSGNRLYRGLGDGSFEDVTDTAGVREGDWGWGTCAADFDNDGWLDLFMVNGYQGHNPKFANNSARLFMNDGDGSFTEEAIAMGIDSSGQGRAVVCFDSNNNGQIDVLVQRNSPFGGGSVQPEFYRNLGHPDHHWLRVRLRDIGSNRLAVGARLELTAGGATQVREIHAGNNYLSSEPIEAHFGLGTASTADLTIRWPDGTETNHTGIEADQILTLDRAIIFSNRFE